MEVDRSAERWKLDRQPTITILGGTPDTTEQMGLNKPNIWTQGGTRIRMDVSLEFMVEIGATAPCAEEIAQKIIEALR